MTSTSTLPRDMLPRPELFNNPRMRYVEGYWERPYIAFASDEKSRYAARQLTEVERATVRIHSPSPDEFAPSAYGLAVDASAMLTSWAQAGSRLSGWDTARNLQDFYFPQSSRAREPLRGWALLAAVDATAPHHGVTVSCSTLVGDTYQRARLAQVLASRIG